MSTDTSLTEQVIDMLTAADDGLKSSTIARGLGKETLDIREELKRLEALGLVYRTGSTKDTVWYLG